MSFFFNFFYPSRSPPLTFSLKKMKMKNSFDYEAFTGRPSHDGPPIPAEILPGSRRVPAAEAAERLIKSGGGDGERSEEEKRKSEKSPLFLDVRPESQFGLARLPVP